ncbi:L-lactate dehydrogenase complex protein LldG [Paraburkholderia youngii]|uniref:LutC/YkgG family protein n=1 Tax=Paraburkholderia youngii TaxID=2782701 RepID=UPI003D1CEB90
MSSRTAILTRLREVSPAPRRLPEVPMFDTQLAPTVDTFRHSLDRLGVVWCPLPEDGNLEQLVRARFPAARVVCSATPEFAGNLDIASVTDPRALHDVDVGIVRPAFAVAETGSIWLSEAQYNVNALGYLSQHLIALLDSDDIVDNLHHAYHRREFFEANYAVLMSGPSATADIEGVLVRGAQGIRSLTVVPLPKARSGR